MVRRGIEQRDAAVRAGATGACTLVLKAHQYIMPMAEADDWKLQSEDSMIRDLEGLLQPKEGDAVTIVSAPDRGLAEHGAVAAALSLVK